MDQAQPSQIPESLGEETFVGEITILNFQELGFSDRENSMPCKPFSGFLREIGIQIEDFLAPKRFIYRRD
jgi:hypothetical protein